MTASSIASRRPYSKSGSLSAVNAAHTVVVQDAASILFGVFSVTTADGIVFVAEGRMSDTGPWLTAHLMPTQDLTPGTPIAETAPISTLPTQGWRVDTQGFSQVRFRMSARVGGSVVVEARLCDQAYA